MMDELCRRLSRPLRARDPSNRVGFALHEIIAACLRRFPHSQLARGGECGMVFELTDLLIPATGEYGDFEVVVRRRSG